VVVYATNVHRFREELICYCGAIISTRQRQDSNSIKTRVQPLNGTATK